MCVLTAIAQFVFNIFMPHACVNVLQQGLREDSGRQGAFMATLCGCEEPEGADSFLCEEFGKIFWRQRVAFD